MREIPDTAGTVASRHERWVINKIRALGAYYSKGVEGGSEFRHALNRVGSLAELRDLIASAFTADGQPTGQVVTSATVL